MTASSADAVAAPTPLSATSAFTGFVGCGICTAASRLAVITSSGVLLRTSTRFGARHTPRAIFHSVMRTISSCIT